MTSCAKSKRTSSPDRSEEHTSELQSPCNLVCRLLLEKKNHLHPVIGFTALLCIAVLADSACVLHLLYDADIHPSTSLTTVQPLSRCLVAPGVPCFFRL